MNECPACRAGNPPENKFCGQCGSRLPGCCLACGALNPADHKFCGQCGVKLGDTAPPLAAAPPQTASDSEAERRQLTVMFCDLADSTALSERFDPEDLRQVITQYQDVCGAQIEAFGGYIARYMGDGILVYFGYPQAHEDDPERAVRTGLRIVEGVAALEPRPGLRLHVRLGIATGLVVAGDIIGQGASEEHAVLGVTPNLAARLQSLAEADSVVIGDATRRLVGGFFEYRDLGRHQLKGISEPEQAWQVLGEGAAASRFEATAGSGLSPLVGRQEEVGLVLNRWRQTQDGEGQVVVFSGEAGVGKSRIVEAFRSRLDDGSFGALSLSCSPFHTNSALYPVIECLGRVMGFERDDAPSARADKLDAFIDNLELPPADIAPYLASVLFESDMERYDLAPGSLEEQRKKVSEALLALMLAQSQRRPMIMVVEDAQWLDPSSAEFLGLLIERLRNWRLFMLITARPDFEPRWGSHPHLTTLALNRLSRSDSAALVQHVTAGRELPEAVLEQIVTKTDGIPLFVEELTKTVLETGLVEERDGRYQLVGPPGDLAIPASLQDSLMARLDRLGQVKEVAQLAAVLGRRFPQALLAAVSQLGAEALQTALDQLVEAEVLFQSSLPPAASYEFKHGMVQETAYGSLLKSTRQRHHGEIAETLAADFPETAAGEPELLAHHYSEAGLAEAAVPYWQRAGQRAAERWASAESVGHVERGLELLETLPDNAQRAEQEMPLLLDLVGGLRILDRYDAALAALDRAQAVAENYQRIEDLAQVHYYRGSIYFPMGDIEGCLREHELARENARRADPPEKEARALSGLGDAYYMRGHMATSHRHFDACVELARVHGLATIEPPNLAMRGHTQLYLNQLEAGLIDTLKAAELARRQGNERAEMVASGSCAGKLLFDNGQLTEARQSCQHAIELANGLGARRFDPVNQVSVAKVALIEGRRDEAIALAEQAVATTRETGPRFAGPMALGTLALVSDREEVRRQAISEGLAILDSDCVSHNYLWFYRDAMEACLLAGNFPGVEALAQAAADYTSAEPLPWMDLLIDRARTLAQAATAPDEGTREHLQALRDQAASVGFKVILPSLDAALAD